MNVKLLVSSLLWAVCLSLNVCAYEVETHAEISVTAYDASVLNNLDFFKALGITVTDIFDKNRADPRTPKLNDGTARGWIREGAVVEDNISLTNIRPLNHFFNPVNGAPLSVVVPAPPPTFFRVITGKTSPDWALEDRGLISNQEFSYRDARQYFYNALTDVDRKKRDAQFGLTFQSIGQIVHHIQDMAQPQHVRGDSHIDIPIDSIPDIPYIENPSVYEKYTNRLAVRNTLPTDFSQVGYDITDPKFVARFNKPRNFWEAPAGEGIAQFTNFNFLSAGTNFDNPGIFNFPLFTPTLRSVIDIQDLCANANPRCPNTKLKGKMTFYGNIVEDRYTGQKRLNPLASTNSMFDADLLKKNAKQAFTLNRFNFEVGYGFLIPRAVAYSAGLINYFFRGKIDVEQDPANNGKLVVRNFGPEAMSGSFGIYYDAVDDKRYPLGAVNRNAAPGEITAGLALQPIPDGFPKAKTPGEYVMAFRGDMGEEKASAQTVGAVTGKVFYDPYLINLRRVAFNVYPPGPNSPAQTYGFFGSLTQNFPLGNLVAETTEKFRLDVNGTTYPCFVFNRVLVYCFNNETFPFEEFYFDPTGAYSTTRVPRIEWFPSISPSGKITLYLGDAVFYSLTYAAETLQDYSAVNFPNSFRWDTSRAVSITSGFTDR